MRDMLAWQLQYDDRKKIFEKIQKEVKSDPGRT